MRVLVAAVFLAAVLPGAALARSDTSIRCAGGLVQLGDATIDLLGKCGAATLREARVDQSWTTVRTGTAAVTTRAAVGVERWTYDFGPQRFLAFVTLEGGKIVAIENGGYGYATAEPAAAPVARARCAPEAIHVGDATIDLLARCGEPAVLDQREEIDQVEVRPDAGTRFVSVGTARSRLVEIWTYDFGPQSFVRFARVENGVVTRVETGSHGYAR